MSKCITGQGMDNSVPSHITQSLVHIRSIGITWGFIMSNFKAHQVVYKQLKCENYWNPKHASLSAILCCQWKKMFFKKIYGANFIASGTASSQCILGSVIHCGSSVWVFAVAVVCSAPAFFWHNFSVVRERAELYPVGSPSCTVLCWVPQSCPALCSPMDCSLPGSSVLGDSPGKNIGVGSLFLLQGSPQPRNQTRVPCIAGGSFTSWATREASTILLLSSKSVWRMSKCQYVGCRKTVERVEVLVILNLWDFVSPNTKSVYPATNK